MPTLYETFNELLFESYCKTCINNAILKERMKKATRACWEQPISTIPETELYKMTQVSPVFEDVEREIVPFYVRGKKFCVHDQRLGNALFYLMPRDREIILLYYFADMSDQEIAHHLQMPRATVQRRREHARKKLRHLLEENI